METVWFIILALMLATYVVLDGFDLGAGVLHLFVARTDEERRQVIAAIGPVWDGNEVWLLASGGVLVFAFPRVYAAGFSGFYMPLMMVLWLLVLRGIAIEFRSKEASHLWRSFWDGTFFFSSTLLAIVLGAALGNLARGVPLQGGYFNEPLFTTFRLGRYPGVLDWYTVSMGVFALALLAGHGALYLLLKTTGPVADRVRRLSPALWGAVLVLWLFVTLLTWRVQPPLFTSLADRPWTWVIPLLMLGSLVSVFGSLSRGRELAAFLSSGLFIVALLGAMGAGLYPNLLVSTVDPVHNLTVANASNATHGLTVGLYIWLPAIVLAIGYFTYLFRSFQGKVNLEDAGYGH